MHVPRQLPLVALARKPRFGVPKAIIGRPPSVEGVDSPNMKKPKIRYALRAHRRSAGLSQKEVATLLGLESAAQVCHIEQGTRDPSFSTAFACSALFGAPLGELFPRTALEVSDGLRRRSSALCDRMRGSRAPHAADKARFLGTVPITAFRSITCDAAMNW